MPQCCAVRTVCMNLLQHLAAVQRVNYHPRFQAGVHSQRQRRIDRSSGSTCLIIMGLPHYTCEHQQLPLMDCPLMKLMVNPDATPVAHHKPVPVPLHWREAVKQGLDQDVRLGVIEPVPVGEPVTWCHRMVVCAKKNGKPRRTVDLQALNKHAARETHHTAFFALIILEHK